MFKGLIDQWEGSQATHNMSKNYAKTNQERFSSADKVYGFPNNETSYLRSEEKDKYLKKMGLGQLAT